MHFGRTGVPLVPGQPGHVVDEVSTRRRLPPDRADRRPSDLNQSDATPLPAEAHQERPEAADDLSGEVDPHWVIRLGAQDGPPGLAFLGARPGYGEQGQQYSMFVAD
jgi:hypothetical protein